MKPQLHIGVVGPSGMSFHKLVLSEGSPCGSFNAFSGSPAVGQRKHPRECPSWIKLAVREAWQPGADIVAKVGEGGEAKLWRLLG